MKSPSKIVGIVLLVLALAPLRAQEMAKPALSNVEIHATYPGIGSIVTTLQDGKLGYRWVEGQMKGLVNEGLDYRSKELRDSVYLVSFHVKDSFLFITLVFDLERMVEHHTSLLFYGTPREHSQMLDAEITKVDWLN